MANMFFSVVADNDWNKNFEYSEHNFLVLGPRTWGQNLSLFRQSINPKIIVSVPHENVATGSAAENRGKSGRCLG